MSAHRVDPTRFRRTDDAVDDETTERFFDDLLLPSKISAGLKNAGFIHPSPIQWSALPLATKVGVDMMVQSKSGTGKTLVFVVTALNMVNPDLQAIQALVIAPTREIAVQGSRLALDIAGPGMSELKVQTFIGGIAVAQDEIKLKKCHLAIGTPGRIKQLIEENLLSPQFIRFLALDEADRLMDPSFKNDVTWIFNRLPPAKQVMALSATYPEDLAKMLTTYMKDPVHVRLNQDCQVLKGVSQYAIVLPHHPQPREQDKLKLDAILSLLSSITFSQCLVFTNFVTKAESFCEKLNQFGWPAIFIASSQDQLTRLNALNSLKQFQCRVLLTTDLTARGIDARNVNFIINLDVPWDPETYLHRIGRAGRFGSYGVSVSLAFSGYELDLLRHISFKTGSQVSVISYTPKSTDQIPDLGKIQLVKNGISKAGNLTEEISSVEKFERLQPLESMEAYDEGGDGEGDGLAGEPSQSQLIVPVNGKSESSPKKKKKAPKAKQNGVQRPGEGGSPISKVKGGLSLKSESSSSALPSVDLNHNPENFIADYFDQVAADGEFFEAEDADDDFDDDFDGVDVKEEINDGGDYDGVYLKNEIDVGNLDVKIEVNNFDAVDIKNEIDDDVGVSNKLPDELPPDFVIQRYKNITGFAFKLPDPVIKKELNLDDARQALRSFILCNSEKTSSPSSQVTLAGIKIDVDRFLKGLGSSDDGESVKGHQDLVSQTLQDSLKLVSGSLDEEWSSLMELSGRIFKTTDVTAAVSMMLSGEEHPLLTSNDRNLENLIQPDAVADAEDDADAGDVKCPIVDATDPAVFEAFDVKQEVDEEDIGHVVPQPEVSAGASSNDGYPEPYRAVWEPVVKNEDEENEAESSFANVVWTAADGLDAFDIDDVEGDDGNADFIQHDFGGARFDAGNFGFPFPDPDAVMAAFLGNQHSWQAMFPIWQQRIRRNKAIIESNEYTKRIAESKK